MAKGAQNRGRIVAQNRRARHDYFIDDSLEAGLVLVGSEVKSLRAGRGNLADSYAGEIDGELYVFNAYIPEYAAASRRNHETRRPRKLLVHRRERDRLIGAIQREGVTLVPLSIYFNERGLAKVEIGVARGKRKYDKRETEKRRDWDRQKQRVLRERG
ncbi:MAG: SsrA-binding protein SmpB [Alphaproteobacteria bacterium]|nr:SsrA-binding protein SmpB [Alphaproteobacteria bacterium]